MNIIVSFLFLSLVAIVSGEKCTRSMKNSRTKLFCYYSKLKDVNSCKCTHVILPANSDVKSIENLRSNLNGVKILVTVHEFNEGLVDLLKKTKVDGLEIDLKKLTSKDDIADFISTARNKLGSDLYTAVSIPVKNELLAKFYDFKGLTKHVDSFILQTAFLGASNNVTFHPSRLSGLWDMQNADSVVDLVTGLGAPISKLVIAAPVQGFQFKLQDEKHTAPGSPALEIKSISREDLCKTMIASNWTLERDQDQAGPYIFRKNQWIAFDDPMSVDIKAKYARIRGLAGLALKDLSQDGGLDCGGLLLEAAYNGLSKQSRAPRGAVLQSLEREILTASPTSNNIQVSPYRITRIIDTEGKIHAVRQDTRTEFECSRQGYFVHPRSCNRFYRCVKFNQLSDEFNVFEFDCPAGLAFDSRVEVCVWPGSLSDGSACSGSSEIAPVPKERFVCPHEAGYYVDPENCRWFFACLDHGQDVMTAYEFRCPFGLVFDQDRLICEWPWLVPKCASGYASSGGVLVEFHGGAYGTHGGVVGVNGAINGDDGPERTGYRLRGAYIKPSQGVVLENYNGLGVLQPVALGGLHGPISEPISKVYSSFGSHGGDGQNGVGLGGNGAVLVGVDAGHRISGGNIQDGLGGNAGEGGLIGVHDGIGDGYVNAGQGNVLVGIGSAGHQKTGAQSSLVGIGGGYDVANANAAQGNVLVGIGSSDNLGHSLVNHGVTHQNLAGNAGDRGVLVGVHGIGGEYANANQGNVLVGIDTSENVGHGLAGANVDQGVTHQNTAYIGGNAGGQGVLVGVHGIGGEYANANQGNVLVGIDNSGNLEHGSAGANIDQGVTHQNTAYIAGNAGDQGVLVGVHNGIGSQYANAGASQDNSDYVGQNLAGANLGHATSYQNIAGNADGQGVLVGVQNVGHGLAGADVNNGGFISGIDHGVGRSELNQGSSQFDSLNRGSIRFNAGLRNDAGKSINQVTYHGNLALSGNADGHSNLGDAGYVEGERILSTVQDVNSGAYRGSLRGSAKYQSNQQLGDGQSTVTYHGNFGNVANEEGQVLVGDDAHDGGVALIQDVQGVDHNVGAGFNQGNFNSQLDRASVAFGTKLRGSKAGGDGAVFAGEKFVSNYIQNGREQEDGSRLGVLIGEQNLGVQDGSGKISQSTSVTYHGNTGASNSFGVDQGAGNIGLEHDVVIHGNQDSSREGVEHRSEGGSLQYNLDDGRDNLGGVALLNNGRDSSSRSYQNYNSGKVNIVKGGFSAVGVYPNSYKQSTPSLSTITASPISVTPVPVTASPIPVVTSVPIPTTHINDNLDVYNGNGVVANVPELQVKVETPSAAIIPNIQRTHTASTGAVLEVDNGGYVYDKPAVSFVEGGDSKFVGHSGAKSYIQQNIEHRQPFLTDVTPSVAVQPVSVNIPQQTGTTSYHFGQTSIHHTQPSLDLDNQKVLLQPQIALKQNVIGSADITGHSGESYSYQNLDKSTIINHATPSILIDQKIARPSPTISSVHFGTALVDQPNPSIVVQPAVESVSTIRPVLFDNIHQHKSTFVETATPSVSIQPVRTAGPVFVENVTPIAPIRPVHFRTSFVENVTPSVGPIEISTARPVTYSTKQDSILTQQPGASHGSFSFGNVHPVQNVEINKEAKVGFVENVTPAIVQQQPVILHQNPVPQGGSSYFYQRNDFAKSTPTLPSASFSFQSLPARGFEKSVDVIENLTPAPILVQQEVKRPVSVVIGDNDQSNFLSSVSKSRGFSKFGQNFDQTGVVHETPFVPVTPVVNVAQPIQTVIQEGGNLNLGVKHRGFAKYTPTIIEATTPQAIAHQETVIGLNENQQSDNAFGTFAYDGFGLKTPNSQSGYYESHHERTGYHYPKPAIRFEEGSVINQDYDNLEPVKEEPFVLKKAYVTGNKYKSVTPTPIFVTSTVNPTYQSTIQSVYNTIPSTTVKPTNFYYYDNRFSSTPKSYEIKPNVVPTVTVATPKIAITTPKAIVSKIPVSIDYDFGTRSTVAPAIITESKPIFKYSFSSFDSQYATTPAAPTIEVTARPVNSFKIATPIVSTYQPVSIKSTTIRPLLDVTEPSRAYLPAHNVIENYQAPILKNRKIVQPFSQAIVKINDFHPLLSAKLGAQCTCIADSVRFRNKPVKVSIDDGETVEEFVVKPNNQPDLLGFNEGESIKDAYIGGDNINVVPDYESQKVVDITPLPEVTIGSTSLAPISRGPVIVRKRLRARPVVQSTTQLADIFLTSTAVPDYEGISQQSAQNFDRYGPGGLRSKTERLQGTVDCQRAGLFRHPTQCNKFYSCRWDCTKNKFTLHVFNCPVHLTFDDSLGACNWPSQGPACLGNTLLPSD